MHEILLSDADSGCAENGHQNRSNMNYEVGKQYEMKVVDIRKDSAGHDYITLHDDDPSKAFKASWSDGREWHCCEVAESMVRYHN